MSYKKEFNDRIAYYNDNNQLHREDGPAIESYNGAKWYKNGLLHREDGPAVTLLNGTKRWYKHGKLHREDGPALELLDGKYGWYLHGCRVKPEKLSCDYDYLKLKYGL